jgi:TP901 family phage tail tape measure protein
VADFKINVNAHLNKAAIQKELNELGKKSSITVDIGGQVLKDVQKIHEGLYKTVTTTDTLNKATGEYSRIITTVTDGIAKQKAGAKELLALEKERTRQLAMSAQYSINTLVAPGTVGGVKSAQSSAAVFQNLFDKAKEGTKTFTALEKKTLELNGGVETLTKTKLKLIDQFKEAISKSITWAVAMGALYGTIRKIREGFTFVYELSNQMNNIRMITGYTADEVEKLAKQYNSLASAISSNTMDVAKSAEVWLRQGRSIEDTNKLIETSMILSKVGFMESAEAANLLTSAINGYQMSAEDAIKVVDKMSAIDVVAATSSQELAQAMAQTASSAKIAGVSMDELLSYIAVVSETTRKSAQSIGNSFKTIFARLQQVRLGSLVDEEGESISNVDTVLTQYGITLRNAQGQFRDTGDVLKDLSDKWQTFDSTQKSELSTVIAGKNKVLMLEYVEIRKHIQYKKSA